MFHFANKTLSILRRYAQLGIQRSLLKMHTRTLFSCERKSSLSPTISREVFRDNSFSSTRALDTFPRSISREIKKISKMRSCLGEKKRSTDERERFWRSPTNSQKRLSEISKESHWCGFFTIITILWCLLRHVTYLVCLHISILPLVFMPMG